MALKGADKPWPTRRQVLRLLPISGGLFAGPFKDDTPTFARITAKALQAGYQQLQLVEKKLLREIDIRMCIFEEKEFQAYDEAFANNAMVQVKGYSVLGQQQLQNGKVIDVPGKEPDPEYVTIVDPAGKGYIDKAPRGAAGASGSIYAYLKIENKDWPEDVLGQIDTFEAIAHAYPMPGNVEQRVVHVIGPIFSGSNKDDAAQESAIQQLAKAYRNVFTAYVDLYK